MKVTMVSLYYTLQSVMSHLYGNDTEILTKFSGTTSDENFAKITTFLFQRKKSFARRRLEC